MCVVFVGRDSGQWLCTFCVYKSNEDCFYLHEQSREEAMSRQLSQHLMVRPPPRSLLSRSSCGLTASSHPQECQYLLLRLSAAEELPEAPGSSASVSVLLVSIGALAPPSGPFEYFLASLARSQTSPPSSRS